ncbi:hypothetical protein ACS106_004667 [Escherichia coli]
MNNSEFKKRWGGIAIAACVLCGSAKAMPNEGGRNVWNTTEVVQDEIAQYSGALWVGGQLYNSSNIGVGMGKGYAQFEFRLFDGQNGEGTTQVNVGLCKYGGSGQLVSNGTPTIEKNGAVYKLRIPIASSGAQNWTHGAVGCAISYNIVRRSIPPKARLLRAQYVRNNGNATQHYFVNTYIKSGNMANGIQGNFISAVGSWEGRVNVNNQSGNAGEITGYTKNIKVAAASLSVKYLSEVTIKPTHGTISTAVLKVTGTGCAKAMWNSVMGTSSELIMGGAGTGNDWKHGMERSICAGDEIQIGTKSSAMNIWGTRSENVTVTWNIQ